MQISKAASESQLHLQVRKGGLPPLFFLTITICFLTGSTAALAQPSHADLVLLNAKVQTMTTRDPLAQAIAVRGDRIVAVGSDTAIRKLIGPSTRVIDAKGRLVIPGFNDAHVHFMGIGNSFSSLNLRDARDPQTVIERITSFMRFLPKGRWLLGGSWNETLVKFPDQRAVDVLTPENPVFLYSSDTLSAFANSRAFQLAGLRAGRTDVDRDKDGNPTGIVRGDAMKRIAAVVPAHHTRNWMEIAETATNYAASLGVTSVQDMHSDDSRAVYHELERIGKLKTRVYDCTPLSDWRKLAESQHERDNTPMVRGGCLKGFSDGDVSAVTNLEREISAADKAGLQVMIHAIGNSANGIALDAFERVLKNSRSRDRRFRIEHAQNPRTTDLPRFARLKIIASMQPHLFDGNTGGYYASLVKLKTAIALGSDAAITDFDPILGIHAAVNAGSESISVYDAVRAYTLGSAYAEFQDKAKGTIEMGKLADFVILSDDIFSVEPKLIRNISVQMTVVGGRIVYGRDPLSIN